MRLLDRPRPDVDVAQLVVAAVESERLARRPGLDDQVMRLGVFLPGQGRDLAVAEVGVHRGADREAGHQPAAADAVEHGELLGHAHRRAVCTAPDSTLPDAYYHSEVGISTWHMLNTIILLLKDSETSSQRTNSANSGTCTYRFRQ